MLGSWEDATRLCLFDMWCLVHVLQAPNTWHRQGLQKAGNTYNHTNDHQQAQLVQWSENVIKADPFFGRSRVQFHVRPWVSNTIAPRVAQEEAL